MIVLVVVVVIDTISVFLCILFALLMPSEQYSFT